MAARELYRAAIRKEKRSSYALLNYALWLYFAPPIAGGGHNAALKTMSQALQYAVTIEDKYFVLVYRSQIFLAMNRRDESLKDLNDAHALIPGEQFTVIARGKNGQIKKNVYDS
jgi:hypothetical protein